MKLWKASSLHRSVFFLFFLSCAAWHPACAEEAKQATPQKIATSQPNASCDSLYDQSRELHPVTELTATFRSDWSLTDIRVVQPSGFPNLDKAAIGCAEAIKIAPATIDGKPVEITWALQVNWNGYGGHSYVIVPRSQGGSHFYPASAVRSRAEGDTILSFHIMPDGSVQKPVVLQSSGNVDLDAAAQAGALEWRYHPAMLNGQPAEIEWKARVNWRLGR